MTTIMRSPTQRVGESTTLRLGKSGTRCLNIFLKTLRLGELGSHYSKFLKFIIDFPNFKRLNQPFKDQFTKK
jgi:hypothetical protein